MEVSSDTVYNYLPDGTISPLIVRVPSSKVVHVVRGKGKKDRYLPLSEHLIRGLKTYMNAEKPKDWLFNGQPAGRGGGDFDGRYSRRGVQWAVKQAAIQAGICKDVHVHTLRYQNQNKIRTFFIY
jgi:integrase